VSRRDALLAVLVAALWGVNFVVIDRGMAGIPPLLFMAIRFVAVIGLAVWFVPRGLAGARRDAGRRRAGRWRPARGRRTGRQRRPRPRPVATALTR
jgi:drug/metabolite transporter (DMT)-like permease